MSEVGTTELPRTSVCTESDELTYLGIIQVCCLKPRNGQDHQFVSEVHQRVTAVGNKVELWAESYWMVSKDPNSLECWAFVFKSPVSSLFVLLLPPCRSHYHSHYHPRIAPHYRHKTDRSSRSWLICTHQPSSLTPNPLQSPPFKFQHPQSTIPALVNLGSHWVYSE